MPGSRMILAPIWLISRACCKECPFCEWEAHSPMLRAVYCCILLHLASCCTPTPHACTTRNTHGFRTFGMECPAKCRSFSLFSAPPPGACSPPVRATSHPRATFHRTGQLPNRGGQLPAHRVRGCWRATPRAEIARKTSERIKYWTRSLRYDVLLLTP